MPSTLTSHRIITKTLSVKQKEDWISVVNGRNVFLSLPYLHAIDSSLKDVTLLYAITYNEASQPIFVAIIQIVEFIYKRNFKFSSYFKALPKLVGTKGDFSIKMAVCGNVFATGQHGFLHTHSLTETEALEELNYHLHALQSDKTFRKLCSAVVLKEFFTEKASKHPKLIKEQFNPFEIDVNMVLTIDSRWKNFDDYLDSLKAKYRTRVHSVYKKSRDLKLKSLDAEDILEHSAVIRQLYDNVLETSDYTYGVLTPETFSRFKENLGHLFSFTAVFYDDKLIGFSTAFFNGNIMEANYVGLDYEFNVGFSVYQRLLYNYLEHAINANCTELHLGRTSELIKSALGATPKTMVLYAKHNNTIANTLGSKILSKISPSPFDLRTPFKSRFLKD